MHRSKYICLYCLRSQKGSGKCCGWSMFRIGVKARAPKQKASKTEWKKFIDLFIFKSTKREQLKRIITLRRQYGLSTGEQELVLETMLEEHEVQFSFFDIKHNENKLEIDPYQEYTQEKMNFIQTLNDLVKYYKENKSVNGNDLVHNKEYFIVPIFAGQRYELIFPIDIEKYEIYKVISNVRNVSRNTFDLRIKTGNINETISIDHKGVVPISSTRYARSQDVMIFSKKEEAIAFRQKYLSLILPQLKNHNVAIHDDLYKKMQIDLKIAIKKTPHLLL